MRLIGLDIFRGYALLLMVIFHFCFDLNNFHYVDFNLMYGDFWHYYRYIIVSMFVFASGISLQIAYRKGIIKHKFLKRLLVLGSASLAVSIGSYTQFPNTWIYFGILHFFLFASIVGVLFLKIPKIALLTGVGIILGYNLHIINMHWLYNILKAPLHLPIRYTEDLANIFPWFGVFLLGIVFGYYKLADKFFSLKIFTAQSKFNTVFSYIGKHSLLIYLLHQPLFFGIFLLL